MPTPPPPPVPLYDAHVHIGASDTGETYYPELAPDDLIELMDAAGVATANVFAPYQAGGYLAANRAVLAAASASGGRLRAFARLGGRRRPVTEPQLWMVRRALSSRLRPPPPDLDAPEDLERYAGVKLLPHLDGVPSVALFEKAAALRRPVLVHAGRYATPRWIARRILPHVEGPLILAHLGSFPGDARLLHDALDLAASHARVWLDTSGVLMASFLAEAARRVPEKLLFGSDAPLAHPGVAWQHLASVVRDPGLLRRIGAEAAAEVFGG